ncbi:MAG: NADP-dependent phosphogluconate dehydrogenase [Alphaproteobacteria bacterium]|nr:NADP-dependent phosphogluconate dehydrogenase [Alphaproteobacteria bacterium]
MAADLGVVGLGVMGRNLALNFADHGYHVAGLDREPAAARILAERSAACRAPAIAAPDRAGLVAVLARPRVVLLLIPAGAAVDEELALLAPLLEPGDIVVDGGNSHYQDTIRRAAGIRAHGQHFAGLGISGGERGARNGPSLMGGGDAPAYARIGPMLTDIAARAAGRPCFAHVGPDGAGHFVKTLHNGIEYALMQLIAETAHVAHHLLGYAQGSVRAAFEEWARGWMDSFLMEVSIDALAARDPESGRPLLELIVDKASQKGTGQWSAAAALEYGCPAPTIAEAVHARCLSALRPDRLRAEAALGHPRRAYAGAREEALAFLGQGLLAGSIAAYAQGFAVIHAASEAHGWNIDLALLARIWQGGCIIRSRLLEPMAEALTAGPAENPALAPAIVPILRPAEEGLRQTVALGALHGVPLPAHGSALAYLDGLRTGRLWANMIEAQRDHFGAHGFARLDRPGKFHHDWTARP